jgi:hypothetical protein
MFVGDIFVLEFSCFGICFVEEIAESGAELLLRDAGDFGQTPEGKVNLVCERFGRRTKALKKRAHDSIGLSDESGQEMQRLDLLMIVARGNLLCFLESFLSLDGKFVETEHECLAEHQE